MAGAEDRGGAQTPPDVRAAGTDPTMLDVRRGPARGGPGGTPAQHAPGPQAQMRAPGLARAIVAAMPGPLARMPAAAFFATAGLTAITALVCGAVLVRSGASVAALEAPGVAPAPGSSEVAAPASSSASAPSPETPQIASQAELDAAAAKGLPALAALAERFPGDRAVLKALLLAHARASERSVAAVAVARKLLELAPDEARDPDLHRLLLRAASGPPDVAGAAFDVMARRMGSAGPDLLYEILTAEKIGKLPQDRADKLLADPEVRKLASPALLAAYDLRRTSAKCSSKEVITRARDPGDARSIHYLRQLVGTTSCGPFGLRNCARCPGAAVDAAAAIKAIEKRQASP
ncbi:MAG: hypothetical protein IT372_35545 [Polyangiaceae bacterium]|nr:hypothetical protein [Polyangiaceae bacterium]